MKAVLSSFLSMLRSCWLGGMKICLPRFWCVGINRRGVVNERVIQERSSEPSWPRVMRGRPRDRTRTMRLFHRFGAVSSKMDGDGLSDALDEERTGLFVH